MKEIDAAIEALEAALSDDQPYLDRCKAALAGLRSLTAKQGEQALQDVSDPAPVNQQLLEALKRISAIPLGDDIEMHMIARAAIAAVKGKV